MSYIFTLYTIYTTYPIQSYILISYTYIQHILYRSLLAHEDSVTAVKFQPYTHYFFSSSKDGRIKYWDADRFECIQLLSGHKGSVWGLSVSSEGSWVVSGGADRTIRVWRRGEDLVFVEEER